MADFRHVSPGQTANVPSRSASWLNDVSDAAAYFHSQIAGGESNGSKPFHTIDRSSVRIKNLTGSDLLRGHYIQLGEFELDAKDPRKIWLEGNLYDEELPNRIGIVTNAVKDGSRVDAVLIGVAVAVVDVTDTDHRFAEPADGEYILVSAESGPVEILDTVTETGEQLCAVILSPGGGSASATSWTGITVSKITAADYVSYIVNEGEEDEATVIEGEFGYGYVVPFEVPADFDEFGDDEFATFSATIATVDSEPWDNAEAVTTSMVRTAPSDVADFYEGQKMRPTENRTTGSTWNETEAAFWQPYYPGVRVFNMVQQTIRQYRGVQVKELSLNVTGGGTKTAQFIDVEDC